MLIAEAAADKAVATATLAAAMCESGSTALTDGPRYSNPDGGNSKLYRNKPELLYVDVLYIVAGHI